MKIFFNAQRYFSMCKNILLVPKIYYFSCVDFWVSSILGMPACCHYAIDSLLAALALPGRASNTNTDPHIDHDPPFNQSQHVTVQKRLEFKLSTAFINQKPIIMCDRGRFQNFNFLSTLHQKKHCHCDNNIYYRTCTILELI